MTGLVLQMSGNSVLQSRGLKPEEFDSSVGATLHAIYRYRSRGRDHPPQRLAGLPRHGALSLLLPRHGALSVSLPRHGVSSLFQCLLPRHGAFSLLQCLLPRHGAFSLSQGILGLSLAMYQSVYHSTWRALAALLQIDSSNISYKN